MKNPLKTLKRKAADWLLEERGIENPAVDLNSDEAFNLLTQGYSGTFSRFGAIWKGVNLIAKALAKTPVDLYKKTDAGRKKEASPLSYMLKYEPNEEMTAYIFKLLTTFRAVYHGNAYAYIERDPVTFRVIGLWPLSTSTYPVRQNGQLWYVVSRNDQPVVRLRPFEVLHIRGAGDDLTGYSLKDLASVSFDMATMAQNYSRKYFENGARPAVVLEHPQNLSPEAATRLKESWNKMYQGMDNSHRTAVLEEGMKANPIASSAKDAMLIDSMKFSIVDIANWLEIPPHKLGDSAKSSYNSIEQENLNYLTDSLDPWMTCWEQECRKKLLTEVEKRAANELYFEFNRNALIQVDFKSRLEGYNKALAGAPYMSINEVRGRENMNNVDVGDDIIFPVNNFGDPAQPDGDQGTRTDTAPGVDERPAGDQGTRTDTAPGVDERPAAISAAREMLKHVRDRMLARISKDYRTAVKNKEIQLWFDGFETKHAAIIRREVQLVADILAPLTGETDITERTLTELMETVKHG